MAEELGQGLSRRGMLQGAVGVAAVAGIAAACGAPQKERPAGTGDPGGSPSGAQETVDASEVPVGSGVILENYVVTQPEEGTFKGFSKVCPHQGCNVTFVKQESIVCPCHGSEFSIVDGTPTLGPAVNPLPEATVSESNGAVTVG